MPGHKQRGAPVAREGGQDRLLSPAEVAEFFGVKVNTLARWRSDGGGPPYIKVGSLVRYRRVDLDRFVAGNIVPR